MSAEEKADHVPMVGIGASAGGVKALQTLFEALPEDLGAAYAVIVHLDPHYQSELAAILQARTKMPVVQVQSNAKLEPNHVYVIPPNRRLLLADGHIETAPFDEPRGQRAPIDEFFRSLAEQHGDGVAIILTGAGADGSVGVKAIKEGGGLILVQDPKEAEYGSMPRNAIATGLVDMVLPLKGIADQISQLIPLKRHPRVQLMDAEQQNVLMQIFALVLARTGHDFTKYKRSTLLRRLARRMQIRRIEKVEDYVADLKTNPEEVQALFRDMSISVTTFFRDKAAFAALARDVIPKLFENKRPNAPIRVWVPGCASGEEAYSIAILLLEERAKYETSPPIQVFASDIDTSALAIAREGRYPSAIVTDVPEDLLRRYFVEEGHYLRVKREVRETMLFASHSLLKDPPFSRVDLVSCRNLLIYLGRELQQQACSTFHYALNTGGFLFLGSSEGADAPAGLFQAIDREARIYQVNQIERSGRVQVPKLTFSPRLEKEAQGRVNTPALSDAALHNKALELAAPPSVLVDKAFRIVHVSETAGRYLLHPLGPPTNDITEIVRPELRTSVRILVSRALEQEKPGLSLPIAVRFNGSAREIILQVRPVSREGQSALVLVFFIEGSEVTIDGVASGDEAVTGQFDQWQQELEVTRQRLKESREEFEQTNEELRAANEELESINEEYRSTAEELETSKEELQSMNEELQTVNNELKLKLDTVSRAHSDLQNLITATDVGTLFLDSALRIKRFTPRIADLFNVTSNDEGRPITDFTHRLTYAGLANDAHAIADKLIPIEREVQSQNGQWYLVRLRPYRTEENKIDGVVITFVDVSERRQSEQALRDSTTRLELAREAAELGIYDIDSTAGNLFLDKRSRELWSLDEDAPITTDMLWAALHPEDVAHVRAKLDEACAAAGAGSYTLEFRVLSYKPAGERWIRAQGKVFSKGEPADEQPAVVRLIGTIQDITERRQAELRQRLLLRELSHRVKNTLAVVQSMARQTLRSAGTQDQLLQRFEGRLHALATSHDILVENDWRGAEFATLARRQVAGLADGAGRFQLEGPAVVLPAPLATPVGLLLHELATNASKHGALSDTNGKVKLEWKTAPNGEKTVLELHWLESGGPPVSPPTSKGFGSLLIEKGIPEAQVERVFRREGLSCKVRMQLPRLPVD